MLKFNSLFLESLGAVHTHTHTHTSSFLMKRGDSNVA